MNENFNEYMNGFKQKTLKEKQEIVIEQLKMLAILTNKMCQQIGTPNEIILDKDVSELKKTNYTEDDFAEAAIVLINSIQNSICDFDLKLIEINNNL